MFNGRGKTNAIDDPDNLDPVITYRHVLSSSVGVQYVTSKMFVIQYDRVFAVTPCMYKPSGLDCGWLLRWPKTCRGVVRHGLFL